MWRLHFLTALMLVLKYAAGFSIPLWLALLPSYIYPTALIVVVGLGILTGRIVMMSLKSEKDRDGK